MLYKLKLMFITEVQKVWHFKLQTNLKVCRQILAVAKFFKNIFTKMQIFMQKIRKKKGTKLIVNERRPDIPRFYPPNFNVKARLAGNPHINCLIAHPARREVSSINLKLQTPENFFLLWFIIFLVMGNNYD